MEEGAEGREWERERARERDRTDLGWPASQKGQRPAAGRDRGVQPGLTQYFLLCQPATAGPACGVTVAGEQRVGCPQCAAAGSRSRLGAESGQARERYISVRRQDVL